MLSVPGIATFIEGLVLVFGEPSGVELLAGTSEGQGSELGGGFKSERRLSVGRVGEDMKFAGLV